MKILTLTLSLLVFGIAAVAVEKPDVLFIAIDDMNDWTTLFDDDNPIQTPNLKRLAARGTFFNRAYCASAGCNPSRTAIMTGLRPTTSGVYSNGQAWRDKVPDAISLPEHLAAQGGYVTRGAGKIYHHGGTGAEPKGRPSFQQFFNKLGIRGPGKNRNYNGYRMADKTPLAHLAFDWGVHDKKMIDVDMCEWVEARMEEQHEQPLFLAAGIFNPHLPFYADAATFERYPDGTVVMPPMPEGDMEDVGKVGIRMSDKEAFVYDQTSRKAPESPGSLSRMVQCYQAAADVADQMVGRLLDKLDETGRAKNTVIVLWSDHGYHLGDKECGVKFTLWEKANHVPFIIVAPGVAKPGSVCGAPVSLVDIFPTLTELAGVPPKADNDGLSLVPLLKNPDADWARPALMTEGPGNHAVRTRDFRYIRYHNGFEELYADDDPWNHQNLAGDARYAEVLARHRKHLPTTEAPGVPERYQTIGNEPRKQPEKKKQKTTASAAAKPAPAASETAGFVAAGETLIANFENGIDGWEKTGTAFDAGPRHNRVSGFLGRGYVNSFRERDTSVGTLTSPPFTIERDHIKFQIGGGNHPGKVGMELLIDEAAVRKASGNSRKNKQQQEVFDWKSWDVSDLVGKKAKIRIFDHHEGGWGHTLVDHIVQADRGVVTPPPATSAQYAPPEKPGVTLKDEWSTFPLYEQVGYDQALRPQFHFSSRMGWLNDPNGMVYYDGEWHMLFQHFAKGNISGAKSWGNAVSTDLIQWEQLPHAINPYAKIDGSEGTHAIWSGSAVVDVHNALGQQEGDTKTLFALYSATHETFFQGGAYSTDKARTWTKINNGKPVIPHQEGFSKGQRDPRIFYYAAGKFYVTIMMIGGPERLVRLWKSTDLLNWDILGDIPNKAAECIDMYHIAVDGDPNNRKWVIADAGTHYEVGEFDGKAWKGFGDKDADDKRLRFDFGDAYYAAQVFNQGPDERVVHVGWLRSKQAGYRPFLEAGMPFTQQMSIPAEITLRTTPDGIRMFRNPVREIEKLYHRSTELRDLSAKDANATLARLKPELIDLTLTFAPQGDFILNVRGLPVRYDQAKQEFQFTNVARVEGEKAAWKRPAPYRDNGLRAIPAPAVDGTVTLRALVDRASLELFVNDGQAAASFVVVPEAGNRRVMMEGNDGMKVEFLVVHELKSAWPAAAKKGNPAKHPAARADKPNVVVIFIDDMGYGDIGPFGSDHSTPNLDRMAAEGMKLTDFYVSSSACTPSRSALMTGCYADRIGMGQSVVFPADKRGLNPDEITLAEILREGGYATGCFGKWHLGDQPAFMPLAQGFDIYEGIPYSNDMWVKGNPKRNDPPLAWMKQGKAVAHIPDADSQARVTDAITDAAVRFIQQNKDRPFFAYVPHAAVHAPHMVTPERLEAAGGDVMRALVGEIDASTGRILDTLKQWGIDRDTLVIFTNDNGGAGKTSNGPLRGHKFGPKYEGHMRVATLARWPGKIPAGSVSAEIGATIDLMPTIAHLAGQSVPDDRIIDGHDISDILLGTPHAKSPHETLFYENDGIRRGKWKLVHYRVKADRFTELYDLEQDLGEQNNIAEQYPDIVADLKAALDTHVADIAANVRPAAFVDAPTPLLADAAGMPTLAEYLGKPAAAVPAKKAPSPPSPPPRQTSSREAKHFPHHKELKVSAKNLILPVVFRDNGLPKEKQDELYRQVRLHVFAPDGKTVVHKQVFDFPRDLNDATYWGYLDVSEYVGQSVTLACDRPERDALFDQVKFSDEQGEFRVPVYTEKERPQYHFTPKQGWNNDPNGLYYLDGLYHMSFQNGALNRGWGNIYWGHAVSKDLLHWEESTDYPRVLRSGGRGFTPRHPTMADGECYSGGAAVDVHNTLGLQQPGGPQTVLIAYTDSSGRGECLAVSTDGGKRFRNLENNPAIVLPNAHDPKNKKSWGRDPKPFWHEPSKRWVIVTYLMGKVPSMTSGHFTFYTSKDLKTWEHASTTEKLFPEAFPEIDGKPNPASRDWRQKDYHECPDFFELPMDGDENRKKWVLLGGAMKYQIGSFDGKVFTPEKLAYHRNMFGDMKAGQAFSNAPGGRVVYVLWSRLRTRGKPLPPFVQGITLPVEFKLTDTADGPRLRCHPIAEMAGIRGEELHAFENRKVEVNQGFSFAPPTDTVEVELSGRSAPDAKALVIKFGEGNELAYDFVQQTLKGEKIEGGPKPGESFSMRFYIDRAEWNVFFNKGLSYHHYARRDIGQSLKKFNLVVPHGGPVTIDRLKVHAVKSVWK